MRDLVVDYADPNGAITPVEINATVVKIAGNTRILSLCRDITERKQMEDKLRESEEKFAKAFQFNPAPMALNGTDGRYVEINQAFFRLLGYSSEDVVGYTPSEIGIFVDPKENMCGIEILQKQGQLENYELAVRTKSGEIRHGLFFAEPMQLSHRPLFLTVMNDITDRKMADTKLRESEEQYRRLIDLLPIGVGVHLGGKIAMINPTGMRFMGAQKPEEIIGKTMMDMLHPDYRKLVKERIQQSLAKGNTATPVEEKFVRVDGTAFDAEVTALPFGTGDKASMLVVFNDITERKQAQEAIAMQSQRIQEVSQKLLEVQEQEKRSLAAELHDDLGQSLTSLKLMLEYANGTRSPAERKQRLATARDVITELMNQVRDLSLDLRPAMLDDFGLFAALRWLFDRFQFQTGITVRCNCDLMDERRFGSSIETAAFRIVQEALTNIARYALVQEAQVSIEVGKELSIEIADQGTGFDVAQTRQKKADSAGLSGMAERAHLLGGRMEIISKKGEGTRIIASLPLKEEAA
jgi:PAS domain S-box-containing protein